MSTIDRRGVSVDATDTAIAGDPNPGLAIKAPARVATTAAITLSGLQTIDAVALASGDRVLVKDQADQTTNGLYNASSGNWTRTIDARTNDQLANGTQFLVVLGTVNGGRQYQIKTVDPIIIGTSSIVFGFVSAGSKLPSGSITLNANATSTVVTDALCETSSCVFLMPKNSHAANDMATTSIVPGAGSFTITHANNARTDRTFAYAIN